MKVRNIFTSLRHTVNEITTAVNASAEYSRSADRSLAGYRSRNETIVL